MPEIQIYYTQHGPGNATINYDPSIDFANRLTDADKRLIESNWARIKKANSSLWPGELGTLIDSENGNLRYGRTSYDVWRAAHDMLGQDTLSQILYNELRVSSVGIVVMTRDEKILVLEKPTGFPAEGKLDSSANGFCEVKNGKLDFDAAAREKLERELGMASGDIRKLGLRGVHSASDYYSGMLAYYAETSLTFDQVNRRANPKYVHKLHGIGRSDLADYVSEKYAAGELIGDGAATLLGVLDKKEFFGAIEKIKSRGGKIRFGKLSNGNFVESIDNFF